MSHPTCDGCGQPSEVLQQCQACPRQFTGGYCGHLRGTCPDCGCMGEPVPNIAPEASPGPQEGPGAQGEAIGSGPSAQRASEAGVMLTMGEWHALFAELAAIRRDLEGGGLMRELQELKPLLVELGDELPDIKAALAAVELEVQQTRADLATVRMEVTELGAKLEDVATRLADTAPPPDAANTTTAPADTAGG